MMVAQEALFKVKPKIGEYIKAWGFPLATIFIDITRIYIGPDMDILSGLGLGLMNLFAIYMFWRNYAFIKRRSICEIHRNGLWVARGNRSIEWNLISSIRYYWKHEVLAIEFPDSKVSPIFQFKDKHSWLVSNVPSDQLSKRNNEVLILTSDRTREPLSRIAMAFQPYAQVEKLYDIPDDLLREAYPPIDSSPTD